MNNKGIALTNYIIATLVFGAIIVILVTIPGQDDGFYSKYDYTPGTNSLDGLDQTNNMSLAVRDMVCDINPEDAVCGDIDRGSIIEQAGRTISGIIQGGYGVIVTISKTIGVSRVMIDSAGNTLKIDPIIINLIITILIAAVFITIMLIIFNRSGDV